MFKERSLLMQEMTIGFYHHKHIQHVLFLDCLFSLQQNNNTNTMSIPINLQQIKSLIFFRLKEQKIRHTRAMARSR